MFLRSGCRVEWNWLTDHQNYFRFNNCEANAVVQKYIKIVVIFLLGACFVAIGMSTLYYQLIVW